jgi:hypothetical protein
MLAAVKLFELGRVSSGRAAELAVGQERLDALMGGYERGLLRKAQALRVAVQRGLREPLQP